MLILLQSLTRRANAKVNMMKNNVAVNMSNPMGEEVIKPSSWSNTIIRPIIEMIAATMRSLKKPLKIPRFSSLKITNISTVKRMVSPKVIIARDNSTIVLTLYAEPLPEFKHAAAGI